MQPVHPTPPHTFAGSPLDRMDASRRDADWVARQIAADDAVFLPVWRSRNLIGGAPGHPEWAHLAPSFARPMLGAQPWAILGLRDGRPVVAIDLSALDDPLPAGASGRWEDLRRVGGLLPAPDAAILAHARGLMHWRTRHRFCGVCGAACAAQSAGHVMACAGCGAHHFPRTDPAVIMLVTCRGRALLGLSTRFRDLRMFSTLAGFVEPGESLEEAVAREVMEEAAVRVGAVRYRSSQPWPFPCSIMLGFTAEAQDSALTLDPDELAEAGWFTPAELRAPQGFVLPPAMSIARRLIDEWVTENT
jgi:NAD+ diphosphatase